MTAVQSDKVPLWLKWEQLTRACQTPDVAGSAGALLVMRALLEDLDRDGRRQCYPSLDRLARITGLSRRSVVTAVKRLEAAKLITRHAGGGRGCSTRYTFPWIEERLGARASGEPAAPNQAEAHAHAAPAKATPNAAPDTTANAGPTPDAQGALLLPLDGGNSQGKLAAKISRRFVVRRDDAIDMVARWCVRADAETVRHIIDDAIAEGVERAQLARYVADRLRPRRSDTDPEGTSSAGRDAPEAEADPGSPSDPRWQRVRARLRTEVGQSAFDNWMRRVTFMRLEDGCVELCAPSQFVGDWVRSNYADRLRALWTAEDETVTRVVITHRAALPRTA
jgi:hypothetical protein